MRAAIRLLALRHERHLPGRHAGRERPQARDEHVRERWQRRRPAGVERDSRSRSTSATSGRVTSNLWTRAGRAAGVATQMTYLDGTFRRFAVSPDGQSVAFVRSTQMAPGELFRMPLAGGVPQQLTDWGVEVRGSSRAAEDCLPIHGRPLHAGLSLSPAGLRSVAQVSRAGTGARRRHQRQRQRLARARTPDGAVRIHRARDRVPRRVGTRARVPVAGAR